MNHTWPEDTEVGHSRQFRKTLRKRMSRLNRVGMEKTPESVAKTQALRLIYAPINQPDVTRPPRCLLLDAIRLAFPDVPLNIPLHIHLYLKAEGLCAVCLAPVDFYTWTEGGSEVGRHRFSIDHIIPRAQGGCDKVYNYRLTHQWCNKLRDQWKEGEPIPRSWKGRGLQVILDLAARNAALPPDERTPGYTVRIPSYRESLRSDDLTTE